MEHSTEYEGGIGKGDITIDLNEKSIAILIWIMFRTLEICFERISSVMMQL